jgi:hypothetical protein
MMAAGVVCFSIDEARFRAVYGVASALRTSRPGTSWVASCAIASALFRLFRIPFRFVYRE